MRKRLLLWLLGAFCLLGIPRLILAADGPAVDTGTTAWMHRCTASTATTWSHPTPPDCAVAEVRGL